jgi:hypothetical protein
MYTIQFTFEKKEHFDTFKTEIIEDLKDEAKEHMTITEEPELVTIAISKDCDLKESGF